MTTSLSWRTSLLVAGLLASTTLAVALVRTRAQRPELAARAETLHRETGELDRRAGHLRTEIEALAETETRQRVRASMVLSPAARAQRAVGATVARFKAQHAVQPPPPPLPPPPTPREGLLGMVFPELMADPEYARCVFLLNRHRVEREHRKVLEALGCDPRTVEAAIDLLTERELVRYEVRSLDPTLTRPGSSATEQRLRLELDQQLRRLLGEAKYAGLEEPGVMNTFSRKPDGTRERISLPGIPLMRQESRQRAVLSGLASRLSYSDEPLESKQHEALVAALVILAQKNEGLRLPSPDQWSAPELAALFKSVLTPGQLPAVEALQAEAAAYRLRAQLPKGEVFR